MNAAVDICSESVRETDAAPWNSFPVCRLLQRNLFRFDVAYRKDNPRTIGEAGMRPPVHVCESHRGVPYHVRGLDGRVLGAMAVRSGYTRPSRDESSGELDPGIRSGAMNAAGGRTLAVITAFHRRMLSSRSMKRLPDRVLSRSAVKNSSTRPGIWCRCRVRAGHGQLQSVAEHRSVALPR